jgi:hypothetical protein
MHFQQCDCRFGRYLRNGARKSVLASGKFAVVVRMVVALAVVSAPLQAADARSCCHDADAGVVTQHTADRSAITAHAEHGSANAAHCAKGGCQCAKACKKDCSGGAHGGVIDMSSTVTTPVSPVYDVTLATAPPDTVLPADTPPPR